MLSKFLIFLSKATWAQRLFTSWEIPWRVAKRFVAGNNLREAIEVVSGLNTKGINVTLDHLGENTTTVAEANNATRQILGMLEEIGKSELRANISIKLTQIGLGLGEDLCRKNLKRILACAREARNFIRLDMEDTPYTDRTIRLFHMLRGEGFINLGLVIQSYLFRTERDARALLSEGARLRLVKGAYKEPANLAYRRKADVDANFDLLSRMMIDAALLAGSPGLSTDGRTPPIPAFGTHDEKRIAYAKSYAEKVRLPKSALEFQMLYGIRRDLQEGLAWEGYPVRVYVPYGTHWYPYFMRRLAERPANLWFFVSNFFK